MVTANINATKCRPALKQHKCPNLVVLSPRTRKYKNTTNQRQKWYISYFFPWNQDMATAIPCHTQLMPLPKHDNIKHSNTLYFTNRYFVANAHVHALILHQISLPTENYVLFSFYTKSLCNSLLPIYKLCSPPNRKAGGFKW